MPLREGVLESVWFVQALCRAVRPLATGEPVVACRQFVPTVWRAARPAAVSGRVVAVERLKSGTLTPSQQAKPGQNIRMGREES